HAVGGRHAQLVELTEVAVRQREANADIHLVVRVVGTVVADLDAVRDELNGVADGRDVRAETGGLRAVHAEAPLDAGNRPGVGNVDQIADLREARADLRHRIRQQLRL